MPAALAPAWTFFYSIIWGFALVFSGAFVAAFASRRFTATFFTAMMLSWFVGGIVMAYAISAAGPVFAHLADPELAGRFLPLRHELVRILGEDDPVLMSQRYLAAGAKVKIAAKGGGISAMPSMHIATATILVIAALRTRWLLLAGLFWVMTFFGSIYLGFHYAVDAPIAAVIAALCWAFAHKLYANQGQSMLDDARGALVSS
jgi:membrane-associated phospholipid phosphatase